MDPCLDLIYQREGEQRAILLALHELLADLPEMEPKIRHGIPFYYRKSWICYLNPVGKDKVELGFTRGNELANEQGLLRSRGRKQVSGILFDKAAAIPNDAVLRIVQEAMLLDEEVPYRGPARRRKPG